MAAGTSGHGGPPSEEALPQALAQALDRALSIQQRIVVRQVETIRRDRPFATPAEVIEALERRFLRAVVMAGAAVGGTAAIPGVGTATAVALGAGEVVGFLEAATVFTLAVAQVHGISVEDVERRRALVLSVLLGLAGRQLPVPAGQPSSGSWGRTIAGSLPAASLRQLNRSLLRRFILRFGTRQGAFAVGRLAPFGIGAVIGGSGNRVLGHRVVHGAREAFGPPPASFTG